MTVGQLEQYRDMFSKEESGRTVPVLLPLSHSHSLMSTFHSVFNTETSTIQNTTSLHAHVTNKNWSL